MQVRIKDQVDIYIYYILVAGGHRDRDHEIEESVIPCPDGCEIR